MFLRNLFSKAHPIKRDRDTLVSESKKQDVPEPDFPHITPQILRAQKEIARLHPQKIEPIIPLQANKRMQYIKDRGKYRSPSLD